MMEMRFRCSLAALLAGTLLLAQGPPSQPAPAPAPSAAGAAPTTAGAASSPPQAPPFPASSSAAPQTAPLKVTTRLVQVNVLVHDHRGNPVGDLTKDDFEVADNGKVQRISTFSVESLGKANGGDGAKSALPVMARNIVTNRPEREARVPTSVTVLLLDMYNTKLTDQMYARQQMIKFLRQIRPEDRVAVYSLSGNGFSIIHDFTNNSETLLAALAKVVPGFSHELDGSQPELSNTGSSDADALIDSANTTVSNFYTQNLAINTCLAFKALANHLAGVPGRKNVVWVSGGFPVSFGYGDGDDATDQSAINAVASQDKQLFSDYIQDASQAMNTANAAVYPVDARGLMGIPLADASRNIRVNSRMQIPDSMTRVDRKNIESMQYIAELTGGKAFYDTNDIQGAIRKAIDDSSITYTVGYYVSDENWDSKYHKLKVKVKRSGVTVRTKKGYLALELVAPTPAKLDRLLHEAVWSPLDSTSIGLAARIDPSPALPNASRFFFSLNPSELQFQQEKERYRGSLDVVFVQQTKRGKMVANFKKTINLNVTPDQLTQMRLKGLRAGQDLALERDTQAVRIVVLDRGTGATGSVTVPVSAQDKSGANVAPPEPAPSQASQKPEKQ